MLQLRLEDTLHTTLDAIDATRRRAMRRGPRLSADSGPFTSSLHHEDQSEDLSWEIALETSNTRRILGKPLQNTSSRHCSAMATLYVGFSRLPKGIS